MPEPQRPSAPGPLGREVIRRRIILIKRALQMKYVMMVFFSVLITATLVSLDLYYVLGKLYIQQAGNENVEHIMRGGIRLLAIHIPIFLVIVVILSIFISHKFAGPLFRLEKVAEAISKGDLTVKAVLREGDELMDTAEHINRMIELLRQKLLRERNLSDRIAQKLTEIRDKTGRGALTPQQTAEQLSDLLLEVQHIASDFKF